MLRMSSTCTGVTLFISVIDLLVICTRVLGIRDILLRIRIPETVPLTNVILQALSQSAQHVMRKGKDPEPDPDPHL
jgi:hypothetical protein